jgi:hypothetical protein
MPDPLSHHPAMLIIKPDSMPRFWWLCPWAYARQLHRNCNALRALCDRQDDLLKDKLSTRPRWSIWISGLAGPDRKYLFKDNNAKANNVGDLLHCVGSSWTIMKDPEDAIIFCDRLNKGEVK